MRRSDIRISVSFESLEQAEEIVGLLTEKGLKVAWEGPELSDEFLEVITSRRSTANKAHGKIK